MTDSVGDAIAETNEALDRALMTNDPVAAARCFTENAILGESGMADVVGRDAIRDFLAAANQKRSVTHHRVTRDELILAGDRAIEVARFEETKAWPDRPPVNEWGRVVSFWRREPDGVWRIERLVVSDLPEPS